MLTILQSGHHDLAVAAAALRAATTQVAGQRTDASPTRKDVARKIVSGFGRIKNNDDFLVQAGQAAALISRMLSSDGSSTGTG
jgi:hypothetical protein